MIGTLANVATVIVGTIIGLILHQKLPKRIITIVFHALGIFTLFLGFNMSFRSENFLVMIFSLVLGSIIGEALQLESVMNKVIERIKRKAKLKSEKFTEGVLTSFLLFCMGSMTILGAIEEGMGGEPTLLLTKSVMDGFAAIALAAALGIGVGFSVIPLLIYQGGLTLLAAWLGNFFPEHIIGDLTAVGGLMLIGLGLNILEIKKIKIFNMLPALVFVVILSWFFPG